MRSIFPYTPTMRYERMFVAAVAAMTAGAVGVAFLSGAIQAADTLTIEQLPQLGGTWQQVLTLALLGGGCLSLSMSFTCSLLIKIQVPRMEQYIHIYKRVQWFALSMLYVACAFGFAFTGLQLVGAALK